MKPRCFVNIYTKNPDRPLPAAVTGSNRSGSTSSLREFSCVTHVILALELKYGGSEPRKMRAFRVAFHNP